MISQDLSSLADWVITWAAKNEPMPPPKAAHLADVLLDLSRQVRSLERLPIDLTDATLVDHHEYEDADSVI
jgi:hypothetical protein